MCLRIFYSTGKRRYGHPALVGVLPQPWLPLKKGQTLVNYNRVNGANGGTDANHAVVLTLRQRKTSTNKGRRSIIPFTDDALDGKPRDPAASIDPWQDAAGPSQPRGLNHRFSFDNASGVIVLPDDSRWLSEDSDSEELEESPTDPAGVEVAGLGSNALDVPARSSPSTPSKRFGTYYHHPEKRRQTIPGAFPHSLG